ncbi:hypothetical protein LTR84_001383 [Exophiala bonariae]|uniref:Transcription factor domain-containing protein n=1 Tax=Exophiala bonariae TaxID=1690606 RepID=A0AAV9NDB2_9EURO|nr:hypothetical protein LTR84_001383 [Exophiala bonariae]
MSLQLRPRIATQSTFWAPESLLNGWQDVQIEQCALTAFFRNYTVSPADHSLSGGYLDGLQFLLNEAKPQSEMLQASTVIALASLGNRRNIYPLLVRARLLYLNLLRSFNATLSSDSASKNVVQQFTTAILLGLYEIITADVANSKNHIAHARGIAAILNTTTSPVDLANSGKLFHIANALWYHDPLNFQRPKSLAVVCDRFSINTCPAVNTIVSDIHPVLQDAEVILASPSALSDDLRTVLQKVIILDKEFSKWVLRQPDAWQPRSLRSEIGPSLSYPSWWPGRLDVYLDLYVAAAWNVFRKTRLMLLDIMVRCLSRLQEKDTYGQKQAEATALAYQIMASIPFHVADNVETLSELGHSTTVTVNPGRAVGGLLLMHPLYVAANLSIVPRHLQDQMRDCLAWIGENMGIGQAAVFSKVST